MSERLHGLPEHLRKKVKDGGIIEPPKKTEYHHAEKLDNLLDTSNDWTGFQERKHEVKKETQEERDIKVRALHERLSATTPAPLPDDVLEEPLPRILRREQKQYASPVEPFIDRVGERLSGAISSWLNKMRGGAKQTVSILKEKQSHLQELRNKIQVRREAVMSDAEKAGKLQLLKGFFDPSRMDSLGKAAFMMYAHASFSATVFKQVLANVSVYALASAVGKLMYLNSREHTKFAVPISVAAGLLSVLAMNAAIKYGLPPEIFSKAEYKPQFGPYMPIDNPGEGFWPEQLRPEYDTYPPPMPEIESTPQVVAVAPKSEQLVVDDLPEPAKTEAESDTVAPVQETEAQHLREPIPVKGTLIEKHGMDALMKGQVLKNFETNSSMQEQITSATQETITSKAAYAKELTGHTKRIYENNSGTLDIRFKEKDMINPAFFANEKFIEDFQATVANKYPTLAKSLGSEGMHKLSDVFRNFRLG